MSTWTVQNFLKGIGVKERHVEAAATTLQNAGYDNEAYLLLATRESLEAIGVLFPVIDLILSHQQQQPPLPPPPPPPPIDQRQVAASNSRAIYDGWSRDIDTFDPPTSEASLRTAVQAGLENALPAIKLWAEGPDQPVSDVIKEETTASTNLSPELENLRSTVLTLTYHGDTEDATHSPVDSLILNPIKNLCLRNGCTITTNRNGVDSSGATLNSLRPDVLLWLPSGVLALKGEDKAFGVGIEHAREDLRKKMNVFSDAFFGSVPYQIVYACSGSHLEFRAFMRTSNPHLPQEIQLTDRIDLSTILGRSLCVRYAINIARILLALHRMNPTGSVFSLGKTVQTPSSTVMLVGEYVTKRTSDYTGERVLTALYEAVKNAGTPHLIRSMDGPKFSRGRLSVNLMPVGLCGSSPVSVDECKSAGRAIVLALVWLHDNGFVHRDIRHLNTMRANGEWFLIDLEWANYENLPIEDYNPAIRPPESHDAGFCWTASADMWQFGKLLESWNQLYQDGHDLVRRLLQHDDASRPSARQALDHAFFSNME